MVLMVRRAAGGPEPTLRGPTAAVCFQQSCLARPAGLTKFPKDRARLDVGYMTRYQTEARTEEQISDSVADSRENAATAMTTTDRSPMLEISNAMVRLYKEAFGRGPTKARAQFAGHDTLVVILESSLTTAERNLVAMGEHQRLREARLFFQYALEDQFRGIVEQALGRRTVAFVSGIDAARDVAMEIFTLEPLEADGSTPSEP